MKPFPTPCPVLRLYKWMARSVRKSLCSAFSWVNNRFVILMFQIPPPMSQFPTTELSHAVNQYGLARPVWIAATPLQGDKLHSLSCLSFSCSLSFFFSFHFSRSHQRSLSQHIHWICECICFCHLRTSGLVAAFCHYPFLFSEGSIKPDFDLSK